MGRGNKVVILSVSQRLEHNVYLFSAFQGALV
jgi:hypothetical protein